MCTDMHPPGGEYLASLRSEGLDVSVAYLASGRNPCIWTQNFFPDVNRNDYVGNLRDFNAALRVSETLGCCVIQQDESDDK